jgi:type I restriction enzyme S subunit
MRSGTVSLSDIKYVPVEVFPAIRRYRIFKEDIFISVAGTLGIVGKIPPVLDGANLTENADRITNICCSRDYLLHVLMSPLIQNTIDSLQTVGAQPKLALTRIRKFDLPIPPTKLEQEAIAEALSDADAYIESLEQLIAKKRQIKQGAMQELLTGKRRLPGFDGEWEIKRLGDICTIGIGRTPSRLNVAYWGSGYPWLSIADLKSKIVSESKEEITPLAAAEMKAVPKNTLLMSFKLSIGRLCFAGCDLYTNEAICSLGGLKADASFLYYLLGRTDFSLYGKQAVKGFTLNSDSLSKVEVFLPEADEQTAIATILSDMDAEITALEDKLAKAHRIKQGMMQELLTGRIRLV